MLTNLRLIHAVFTFHCNDPHEKITIPENSNTHEKTSIDAPT